MTVHPNGRPALFDISPGVEKDEYSFASNVAHILGRDLEPVQVTKFRDSETDIHIRNSVRGRDVFVFQSYIPPVGERLHELYNFLDAVTDGGNAGRVTAVLPHLFGSRGERQTRPRQSTPTKVVARNLSANGADKVVTVCVHATTISTIYNTAGIKFENLEFEHLAANYILNTAKGRVCIASPDAGGLKRVEEVRKILCSAMKKMDLEVDIAFAAKSRPAPNIASIHQVYGNVRGAVVYIVEDIADTCGTLKEAIRVYRAHGAREVRIIVCHPVLSSEANLEEIVKDKCVTEIAFGNTIPLKVPIYQHPKIKVIPIEPFVAEAIRRLNKNKSISDLYKYGAIVATYEHCAGAKYPLGMKLVHITRKNKI